MSKNTENIIVEENLENNKEEVEKVLSYEELNEKCDRILSKIKVRKIKNKKG